MAQRSQAEELAHALEMYIADASHGVFTPLTVAIEGLTAAQAASVPAPRFNSVWALVNHVTFWQEALLGMLRSQPLDRELARGGGWPPGGSPDDEAAWQAAREHALTVTKDLAAHVAGLDDDQLAAPVPEWQTTVRRSVQAMIAHNSYHTCEIITARHMQGWWLDRT